MISQIGNAVGEGSITQGKDTTAKGLLATFDDSVTNISAMTGATKNAGYPYRLVR